MLGPGHRAIRGAEKGPDEAYSEYAAGSGPDELTTQMGPYRRPAAS